MISPILKGLFANERNPPFRIEILIILIGFAILRFPSTTPNIINPDGVLSLHQARAIHCGLNDSISTCSMGFLSNYPILIVLAYKIFGDWVAAAKSVSPFFRTITLVPLYFFVGRFFRREITLAVTLTRAG